MLSLPFNRENIVYALKKNDFISRNAFSIAIVNDDM